MTALVLLIGGLMLSIAGGTWLWGPLALMVGGALLSILGLFFIQVDKPFRR